ncbi:alpha/beta fold hydrolase [Actimicrobium sp. CCI2.3]|uniref:alpha/beta fold hydrolase n=1 Tax=Actimicrobium sp. CCI2.3 TaxID=3048616 RepID=UPI002AB4CE09|nr:alpha/beta fold hydrolase [Actimicrobium sp. CCI2.3]MDY7576255.1 alpha/beta fold hydrolase [Actimicrobium sp. CCI2.3]MEB0020542.1 alpha/beta fold hydrolase [Actimicrobium sp. CCI2.3]
MEFTQKFATVGNTTLRYIDEGSGPAVVLIHGLAGDFSAWLAQIELLRHSYRVIAFDNRGAGQSTQIDEPVSTADLARDTLGLMDYLQIASAHVVGRSMGGAVAQQMALLAPPRVLSMVLCASFARLDPLGRRVLLNMRDALEWRMNWADHARHSVQNFVSADFFNQQPERVAAIERLIGGETRLPACYIRQNTACQEHDTLPELARIHQPVLVMAGASDPICSLTATGWLGAGLPNARTEIFDNASHFFLMEQPERFQQLLLIWLGQNA